MSASEFAFVRGARVGLRGIRRQARAHSRVLMALGIVSIVLLGIFVAALPISASAGPASAGPASAATTAPAAPSVSHGNIAAFGASSVVSGGCSGNINGSCIFSDLWNLFIGFFGSVIGTLESSFNAIFGSFSQGISTMFQSWGFGLGAYGVWGPMMVIVSLGIAAFVAYMFLDAIGIERDLDLGEESV